MTWTKMIKLGSTEWKNRYDSLAAQLGYDVERVAIELAPEVEDFFLGEVSLFDDSTAKISKNPKVKSQIEDYRLAIADPFYTCEIFEQKGIPLIEDFLSNIRGVMNKMRTLDTRTIPPQYMDYVTRTGRQEMALEAILNQSRAEIPVAQAFLLRLSRRIANHERQRALILPSHYLTRVEGVRNKIYRESLVPGTGEEKFIGWPVETMCFLADLNNKSLWSRKKLYDEIKEDHPEIGKLVAEYEFEVEFPEPLGTEKVTGRTLFETLFSTRASVKEQQEVLGVVTEHFQKRRKNILY